jgi:Holliday junction resolvasome RuvABC ATP-dependent DNA helicase subunit
MLHSNKMNDLNVKLQQFVTAYKFRSVPPPHILLVGPDEGRNAMVAADFAQQLGVKLHPGEGTNIDIVGDMTALVTCGGIAFISNIQHLKKAFLQKLEHDLPRGLYEVVIGSGLAARAHFMDVGTTTLIGTCPTKYDCPPQLLKIFETVLHVEPLARSVEGQDRTRLRCR